MAGAESRDTRRGDRHKGDPNRAIRISDELWGEVATKAEAEGLTRREAVIEALERYVGWR